MTKPSLEQHSIDYCKAVVEYARNNPEIGRGMPVLHRDSGMQGVILETYYSEFYMTHCANVLMADGTLRNGVLACNLKAVGKRKLRRVV